MSSVADSRLERQIFTKICRLFLFWSKEPPKCAHPWSAFRPETYLAGRPPAGIIMATRARTLLPARDRVDATPSVPNSTAQLPPPIPIIMQFDEDATEQAIAFITHIRQRAAKIARTAIKPAGKAQDFQLAARLHSVSKLNRIVSQGTVQLRATPLRTTHINRPVYKAVAPKRSRTIQPPAVLRKTQRTGEVVHLNLNLSHVERNQPREQLRSAA